MLFSAPRSIALLACMVCLPAVADEQRYNQISLRAEASSEVAHDRMHVTLYSETQHKDPAQLAAQTTQTLNKALQHARQAKDVIVSQGSRSSYPVYEEKGQQIIAWRERAELRLESADFAALSKLTGELMQDLKMGSMHFSVSDPIRKQNEDALLKDAIAAFRARALRWHGLQDRQPQPEQWRRLPAGDAQRCDEEHGLDADPGSRGRHSPGQHQCRWRH